MQTTEQRAARAARVIVGDPAGRATADRVVDGTAGTGRAAGAVSGHGSGPADAVLARMTATGAGRAAGAAIVAVVVQADLARAVNGSVAKDGGHATELRPRQPHRKENEVEPDQHVSCQVLNPMYVIISLFHN
ncbi:uncharacterized protein LOC125224903 [Leguminivora glycinivorella]|uniref:uncharacterized protein LOC125224903 n=1 Tax=Leguminivora glycinivorella TaxID=1035111 RepID=UPI00200C1E55|nr:uncharacterized protein LOC125224903 [Leguminivora glycinivorella]